MGRAEPTVGGWVSIMDTEHSGVVRKVGTHPAPWVEIEAPANQCWVVPAELALPREDPAIEQAAFDILDVLRSYDPSWSQNDTHDLRCAIAKQVRKSFEQFEQKRKAAGQG